MNSAALGFVQIINPQGHTEAVRYDQFVFQLLKADTEGMMKSHAAIGVTEEAGEVAGVVKQEVHYRKSQTKEGLCIREALIEELGDLRWYMQAVMNLYGIDEQTVLQFNARKLCKRYAGLKYSDEAAAARADKLEGT